MSTSRITIRPRRTSLYNALERAIGRPHTARKSPADGFLWHISGPHGYRTVGYEELVGLTDGYASDYMYLADPEENSRLDCYSSDYGSQIDSLKVQNARLENALVSSMFSVVSGTTTTAVLMDPAKEYPKKKPSSHARLYWRRAIKKKHGKS